MRVLFQGDSVTDAERDRNDFYGCEDGYVKYVVEELKEAYPDVEFINRGVGGDRTKELLDRIDRDLVDLDPDIVTILIGVNDTLRRFEHNDPTSAEEFRDRYETILKTVKEKTNAKIVMIEAFLVYGMGKEEFREDLDLKIDETRKLAIKYADKYIPLNGLLAKALVGEDALEPKEISADGIHPSEAGKVLIADYVSETLVELFEEEF